MRDPNLDDVNLVLRLYDLRRESEMRKARAFVLTFAPATIDELLAVTDWSHPENAHFRQVTSYWEMVADFALRGLFHPDMFASHCGEALVIYARLEPFMAEMRSRGFVRFLANVDALVKSQPAIAERVGVVKKMLEARARAAAERRAATPASTSSSKTSSKTASRSSPKSSPLKLRRAKSAKRAR